MTRLDLSVYAITDPGAALGPLAAAVSAVRGGATVVQLRDKDADDAAYLEAARALAKALAAFDAPLLLNDRPHLVRAAGAAGAHVGQSDLSPAEARALLGPDAILGLSIERPEQIDAAARAHADYFGVGPVRATATKPDHAPPIGFDGLAACVRRAGETPCVGVGGLDVDDAAAVRATGAAGVCFVSALMASDDPAAEAARAAAAWRAGG